MSSSVAAPLPVWLDTSAAGPFVGRAEVEATLNEVWDRASGGRRQAVLVGGPPGIGKSRLVAEAASAAHRAGAVVVHGICYATRARPFEPFVQIFDQLNEVYPGEDDTDRGAEIAWVAQAMSPLEPRSPGGGEAARRRELFTGVVSALRGVSENQPCVVVLDDVHWASEPTLELLNQVVRSLDRAPLLLMMTFRTTQPERSETLTSTLATLHRLPDVTRLDLGALDRVAVREYVRNRAGESLHLVDQTVPLLLSWTGGNPYYLSEVWEAAIQSGGASSPPDTSPTLGDAVRDRLTTLEPDARRVVRAAALSVPLADPDILADALHFDVGEVRSHLDAAVAHGLMVYVAGSYDFVHDLARRAVEADMAPSQVAILHGEIADVLIAVGGDDPRNAARIAPHLAMADSRMVDAVEYASRAGGFAERALAFEEAADHFEGAAALAHEPATRDLLLLKAGNNRMLASQYELALATYRLVCESTDPEKRARAAIGFAEAAWRPGRLGHEAIAQLRRALDGGGANINLRVRTELEAQLARAYGYAGSPEVARNIGESALRAAREIGDDALLAMALIAPGYASPAVEQFDLDRFVEGATLARRLDDVDLLAQATFAQASTSYALGQRATWHQAVDELDSIAERTGQPFHRVALANAMASLAFLRGEYDQALGIVDGILEHTQVFAGRDRVDGLHGSASFLIRRETGLDEVRPLITGDPDSEVGDWPLGLLAIYTELGLRRSASAVLDQLMDSSMPSSAAGRYEGAQAVYLTEAACALGHRPHAQILYQALLCRRGTNLISGFFVNVFGSADRYLGMLAGVLDIEARDHFDAALEMDTHMGATHHRAETLARYAEYLRDRESGESELLAQEAHDLGRLMRSQRIQRIARPRAPASESVLTRRETEVVELIARGCSNRDISEKLFISVNTAANHVRSILIKLDAENRTQAARVAADRGLLNG